MKPDKPSKPIDRLATILREKKTVITRANFWKIPHDTRTDDIHLKIGRYKKRKGPFAPEELDTEEPKSELTLDNTEFINLIAFLRDNYEPFRAGFKAFIPLDRPFEKENAKQIKGLFCHPEKQKLLEFILTNNIIPNDLIVALQGSRRIDAIRIFEQMLNNDLKEPKWQKWFVENDWVLGSEFVRIIDERHIRLRVFERGAGETLACGTGACAAMVVGHLQGHLTNEVQVDLPGGSLQISWQGEASPVMMTGPATTVFEGKITV